MNLTFLIQFAHVATFQNTLIALRKGPVPLRSCKESQYRDVYQHEMTRLNWLLEKKGPMNACAQNVDISYHRRSKGGLKKKNPLYRLTLLDEGKRYVFYLSRDLLGRVYLPQVLDDFVGLQTVLELPMTPKRKAVSKMVQSWKRRRK